jgi:hypothetical protein
MHREREREMIIIRLLYSCFIYVIFMYICLYTSFHISDTFIHIHTLMYILIIYKERALPFYGRYWSIYIHI